VWLDVEGYCVTQNSGKKQWVQTTSNMSSGQKRSENAINTCKQSKIDITKKLLYFKALFTPSNTNSPEATDIRAHALILRLFEETSSRVVSMTMHWKKRRK
jgi:hypothetical protein